MKEGERRGNGGRDEQLHKLGTAFLVPCPLFMSTHIKGYGNRCCLRAHISSSPRLACYTLRATAVPEDSGFLTEQAKKCLNLGARTPTRLMNDIRRWASHSTVVGAAPGLHQLCCSCLQAAACCWSGLAKGLHSEPHPGARLSSRAQPERMCAGSKRQSASLSAIQKHC